MILSSVLAALAGLSFALGVWQWLVGRRFPIRTIQHKAGDFHPAISILKPLKGCDAETEACLESWFRQEYPGEIQLLFGVTSPDDPVCGLVRRLISKYPKRETELVIASPVLGTNAKVSTLCYLATKARHEHLVVSDADVFIPTYFLPTLVQGLAQKSVGIVNCLYIQAGTKTLPMRIEAVAGNADFWTHVLQAATLKPMDFALGAVMALRKEDLAGIGGFEVLLNYLADDFELGRRIASKGKSLEICTTPVECRAEQYGWKQMWQHQVRWGRTIRVCRPVAYFFSILGNGTVWPLLALTTASSVGKIILLSMLALRMLGAVSNYARLTGRREWWVAWVTPLQDIGQAAVWFVSFPGNKIVWRGEHYRVNTKGELRKLTQNA